MEFSAEHTLYPIYLPHNEEAYQCKPFPSKQLYLYSCRIQNTFPCYYLAKHDYQKLTLYHGVMKEKIESTH